MIISFSIRLCAEFVRYRTCNRMIYMTSELWILEWISSAVDNGFGESVMISFWCAVLCCGALCYAMLPVVASKQYSETCLLRCAYSAGGNVLRPAPSTASPTHWPPSSIFHFPFVVAVSGKPKSQNWNSLTLNETKIRKKESTNDGSLQAMLTTGTDLGEQ